jgi:hypothetical protein
MRRGEQSLPTIHRVEAEVQKINTSGILPPGVKLEKIYDRSDLIAVTTETVLHNLVFGVVLIFIIQWLFLGDLRSALVVAATIPFALCFAIANMLPNITLSASDGAAAIQMGQLFGPGTAFWSLAASLTQPLFEVGQLLHKTRAARAAFDQASAQYRSTVITAFQNVADALHAVQSDANSLAAAVAAERAAQTTLNITRRQLELGQVAYLALLNAEQTYQQARINLVQAQAQRYADTAALFEALGGG